MDLNKYLSELNTGVSYEEDQNDQNDQLLDINEENIKPINRSGVNNVKKLKRILDKVAEELNEEISRIVDKPNRVSKVTDDELNLIKDVASVSDILQEIIIRTNNK